MNITEAYFRKFDILRPYMGPADPRPRLEPFVFASYPVFFWAGQILPAGYVEYRRRRSLGLAGFWERRYFRAKHWWVNTFMSAAEADLVRRRQKALDLDRYPRVKPGEDALGRIDIYYSINRIAKLHHEAMVKMAALRVDIDPVFIAVNPSHWARTPSMTPIPAPEDL